MAPSAIERLGADAAAAGSAAASVTPIIAIIDKSIMENASGRSDIMTSIRMSLKQLIRTPHKFFVSKTFGLVFMVYSGTYLTANFIDTATSIAKKEQDIKTVTAGTAKFVSTSTANISLGLIKDRKFTKMFGPTNKKASPLPPATYALFCARDCMTILFSFNIPPRIAKYFPESPKLPEPSSVAQFVAPASCQLLSTPLHLLGLDLYNRQGHKFGFRERLSMITQNYIQTATARIGRIVPAFGIGGVVNTKARKRYLTWVESRVKPKDDTVSMS